MQNAIWNESSIVILNRIIVHFFIGCDQKQEPDAINAFLLIEGLRQREGSGSVAELSRSQRKALVTRAFHRI